MTGKALQTTDIGRAQRRPMAEANWKMAMTVAESLAFLQHFQRQAAELLDVVDVLLCPPYTAIWPMAQALRGSSIQLGAQNLSAADDPAHTGQLSAALAAEAGCRWAVLGHWETRRDLGDDDERVHRKINLALAAGLRPCLMIGEHKQDAATLVGTIATQLALLLAGYSAQQVSQMAFIYEPVWAIGAAEPATPEYAALGCKSIRDWLRQNLGESAADSARILYGGSVSPEYAEALLSSPDIDGLGVGRKGRDAASFTEIVRLVAQVKGRSNGHTVGG